LVTLCQSFDAKKRIEPVSTRSTLPLIEASSVPSLRMMNSSCAWMCGGCDILPTFSVVMWLSNLSKVAVGKSATSRRSPTGVGLASRLSHTNTLEPRRAGSSAAPATSA
jgi:hypothetical protein